MSSSVVDSMSSVVDSIIGAFFTSAARDNRDDFVLPLFFGMSMNSRSQRSDQATESDQDQGRSININMFFINGGEGRSLEELISELGSKPGLKPATQDSIQAMPKVVITEEEKDKECSICLDGWEIGDEAKQMPCKHLYHGKCIEQWLGMHGSCPVCRYNMPLDETRKGREDDLQGERGARFSFGHGVDTSPVRDVIDFD